MNTFSKDDKGQLWQQSPKPPKVPVDPKKLMWEREALQSRLNEIDAKLEELKAL